MALVDPLDKAADCERAIRLTFDPLQREMLNNIREFWIALAQESRFLSEDALAGEIETIEEDLPLREHEHVERKLAAILAADLVGYSRLMGADELGTLRALKTLRRHHVDPTIAAYGGHIVKTTGDGLLVDFSSVVDAVACAVTIQRNMLDQNAAAPEDKRLVFRIGINIGDIIVDRKDIFGDGVNIAARLESICEPGGLCISEIERA